MWKDRVVSFCGRRGCDPSPREQEMAPSGFQGSNVFAALGSRKSGKKVVDATERSPVHPEENSFESTALNSSWAEAETWTDAGEDLGALPDDWIQEEDVSEEPVQETPEAPDHEALAAMAVYEAERAHGIDDMLLSEEDESDEEEQSTESFSDGKGDLNGKPDPSIHGQSNGRGHASSPKSREPERMLSKKEQKAKEMEELDRIFEEMGIQVESKPLDAPSGKSKKKKKKAERTAAAGEMQALSTPSTGNLSTEETPQATEGPTSPKEDVANGKAFVKPKASSLQQKKKQSGKSASAAAKAAAEAKARASKMSKKKDPSKFNQLPSR